MNSEEKRLKHNATVKNSKRVRKLWMKRGGEACAVCHWTGPKSLWGDLGLVEPHHMLGTSTPELICDISHQVPLCPNHHSIVTAAWPEYSWSYNPPPSTREDLVRLLLEYDRENSK